jgi:hypothetical protein
MSEQRLSEILTSVQFVVAPSGKRLAVLNADDWSGLIEWLEDIEDQRVIEAAKERLRGGPEHSGAIPLEDALDEL